MKDITFSKKNKKKIRLLKSIINTTILVKIAQVLSFIYFTQKYICAINYIEFNIVNKLELFNIKKC